MMMKKLAGITLLLVGGAFILGLAQLFNLRFESGDVYPEYSSLRADPLGAKGFLESLDNLIPTDRNYQPLSKLDGGREAVLFYLGEEVDDLTLPADAFKGLESFVAGGGRLVITLFPSFQKPGSSRFPNRTASTNNPAPPIARTSPSRKSKSIPTSPENEPTPFRTVSIRERWGFDFDYGVLNKDGKETYQPATAFKADGSHLPESITCHTAVFFDKLDKPWRVIYALKVDRPVLIERRLGAGTIVLSADSYYLSNEALLKDRQPDLLAWLVGPSRRAIFDETHLGVEESAGLAALARKYRLHGLFAGLLLLAALFVWKNSVSFMPPYEDDAQRQRSGAVEGKESAAGFVNLLRRNIPPREILGLCITEWKKSCAHQQTRAKLEQVQSLIDSENQLASRERDPVKIYQAITKILVKPTIRK